MSHLEYKVLTMVYKTPNDLVPDDRSDFLFYHLSPSSTPATAGSPLSFEHTSHVLSSHCCSFCLNVLHPGIHMAAFFTFFNSPLKCQFIIGHFLTTQFEIAPYSSCPALPQSLFFILLYFSSTVFISS